MVPQALAPALAREIQYYNDGYFVAYHCIPDTRTHNALVLYEANAFLAEIFHSVSHPLLPRLINKHFEPPWDSIPSMIVKFTNDHALEWRRIGIACSASLVSATEAPPHSTFALGYTSSGAPKPDCTNLLVELLQQYGCSNDDLAQQIAKDVFEGGWKHFNSVNGSLLQIFVKASEAARYLSLLPPPPFFFFLGFVSLFPLSLWPRVSIELS